jgi:hypothetical protein
MSNILGNMPPVFGSGYRGVVPAPSAADVSAQNILRADGTWGATPSGAIPSQTGNATKLLTTDGTNASWSGAVTVSGSNATVGGNLTVSGVTTSAGISNSGALTFTAAIGQVAGSIAKNATYGLTYYGVTGSSNDNTMLNASGAVVLSNPAGTTNATLAGNLTVSGTGTSSVAGSLSVGTVGVTMPATVRAYFTDAATAVGQPTISLVGATGGYGAGVDFVSPLSGGSGTIKSMARIVADGASAWNTTASTQDANLNFYTSLGGTLTKWMTLQTSGNLLLGTAADSANGKLQLATHTTSAGGIGFGTDTSLYRSAAGQLRGPSSFVDATFSSSGLFFGASMTLQANDNVLIKTNGSVTALTLDTSQNATFAGDVGLSGNEKYLNLFSTYSVGSNSRARLRAVGSGGGSGYGGSFTVDTRTSGNTFITALTIDDAQNATFAGQITASGISHKLGSGGTGSANALLTIDGSSASSYGPYIVLQRNSTNKWQFGTYSGINGGTSDDFLLYNPTAANEALKIAAATSNATFAGSIAIGNTVNTVSPTSPNRTITMVIGGTTYYIHAKTTND